jgi:hypothetical protein
MSSKVNSDVFHEKADIPRISRDELMVDILCVFCHKKVDLFQPKSTPGGSAPSSSLSLARTNKSTTSLTSSASKEHLADHPSPTDSSSRFRSYLRCYDCQKYAVYCSVCTFPVRGLVSICNRCGHGGHEEHLLKWFQSKSTECATGCGCKCRSQPDNINEEGLNVNFEDDEDDDEDDDDEGNESLVTNPSYGGLSHLTGASTGNNIVSATYVSEKNQLSNSVHGKTVTNTSTTGGTRRSFYDMKSSKPYIENILNNDSEYAYNNFDDNNFDD